MSSPSLHIASGTWAQYATDAQRIRQAVFIEEQHIAPQDEWDAADATSLHFVLYVDEQAVATARLLPNHSIGRVAVLKAYRGLKLGFRLMQHIIAIARQQQRPFVILSAQTHAIGFYVALGFVVESEPYLDCGIPHVDMRLNLQSSL